MADINIKNDSKIVEVLVAQATGERIDSNVTNDAEALYAELYNDPNPMNRYQLAQLVTFAVNEMIPKETNWRSLIADEKQVGDADEAAFRVKNDGIRAFILADGSTTPRSRISHKQIVLPTAVVSARPVVSLRELRAGKTKMSDLVVDATHQMVNVENRYIEDVLRAAIVNWSSPFYGTGAGMIAATLNPMVQHWLRTGSAAIVGDIAAVQKLAELTGFNSSSTTLQYSDDIINEFNKTGIVGNYRGAAVAQFTNPYDVDGVSTIMHKDSLYILPTGASVEDRPLKIVRKGQVLSVDHTDIDEMTYEIRMDEMFGAGIAMGVTPQMSVYVDSTL